MNLRSFESAARFLGTKLSWTDEELLGAIKVHQCLVAYFRTRKEYIITAAMQNELNTLEGYARGRDWQCDNGKWKVRPFIQVEYDPEYSGGNYSKVGQFVYIPISARDVGKAFEEKTGCLRSCIIHYSLDQLYQENGEAYEED